jgi:hypothetical protein
MAGSRLLLGNVVLGVREWSRGNFRRRRTLDLGAAACSSGLGAANFVQSTPGMRSNGRPAQRRSVWGRHGIADPDERTSSSAPLKPSAYGMGQERDMSDLWRRTSSPDGAQDPICQPPAISIGAELAGR